MDTNISLLLVDDDRNDRHLISKFLAHEDYRLHQVTNGQDALERLSQEWIDIVLLDIMMPGMNGLEVCRRIRETYSPTELPIIFITAKIADEDLAEGFSAGGNDYIGKPLSSTVLRSRLNTHIRILKATRALADTHKKLAEIKSMETIGMFAGGVAHNFNNLLGTVLCSAQLIQMNSDADSDIRQAARLIVRAAQRGAELTNSLLTLARPEQEGDCSNAIQIAESMGVFVSIVAGDRITYNVDIQGKGSLPELSIAESSFSRLLLELVKNSIEAIEKEGEINLRILPWVSSAKNPDSMLVTFEFSDTGCGIPPEKLKHIFSPFYSSKNFDPTIGISLSGSGLGLATVQNIVQHAQGAIEILKSGKEGTTIRFDIPAHRQG